MPHHCSGISEEPSIGVKSEEHDSDDSSSPSSNSSGSSSCQLDSSESDISASDSDSSGTPASGCDSDSEGDLPKADYIGTNCVTRARPAIGTSCICVKRLADTIGTNLRHTLRFVPVAHLIYRTQIVRPLQEPLFTQICVTSWNLCQ